MAITCPVCKTSISRSEISNVPGADSNYYPCPLCGHFIITRTLLAGLEKILYEHKDASAKISHAIRQMQKPDKAPTLHTGNIFKILEKPLPKPSEQADLLIRWLAENINGPGETVEVEPAKHKAVIGAKSDEGFALVLDHLFEMGLVKGREVKEARKHGCAIVTLSMDGWNYWENLKLGGAIYRKAFMAMKFGDEILEKVVTEFFKPAVKLAGFELLKLSDRPKAGLIDDRLRVEIQSSDFLVADLSHDNHGAYWEAGYAEGLGKPVIYTCEKTKWETVKTHFDTNHHLTVIWDKDSPGVAGEELKATIRATLPQLANLED